MSNEISPDEQDFSGIILVEESSKEVGSNGGLSSTRFTQEDNGLVLGSMS
jgi:hypothetical protein